MENQNTIYILIKEIVVGVSALIGMALGIYNLFHSISREKVKVKIIPKTVMWQTRNITTGANEVVLAINDFSTEHEYFAFEIINQSNFSVVIDELGFKVKGKKGSMIIRNPVMTDKGGFPRELKSRNSFIAYGKLNNILSLAKKEKIIAAYVKTACDNTRYGTSKALKLLIKYAKETL